MSSILAAILALAILIIIHEGGHFLVARLSGMRVDRFSIGFGPKLWSFKRGETIYQLAAIPFGGFVQIAGLNPGEEGVTADDPRAYPNRPVWQRWATIFAGPGTNYIFAVLVLIVVYLAWGLPGVGKEPVVDVLVQGKPAAAAGFERSDEIVRIDGNAITDGALVTKYIQASHGKDLTFDVLRNGQPKQLHVRAQNDGSRWGIGIELSPREEWVPAPMESCIKHALVFPVQYSGFVLQSLANAGFGGIIEHGSGPFGLVAQIRKQIQHGLRDALTVVALISIYLGLFNLLPLPGLDGGRLAFLLWEAISRRRVNQRIEQTVHMVGVLTLLALIVVITFKNDVPLFRWR